MENDQDKLRFGIVNAYNYWIEIIQPNWVTYLNSATSRTAFNLANSLWSVIEWIKNDPRHDLGHLGTKAIQNLFQEKCNVLGVVHDLATHGKHYTVTRPRSGETVNSKKLTGAVFCFNAPYGPMSEQTVDFMVVLENGEECPLKDIFKEAMDFWDVYFKVPR
jgi:hypothetical protein